MSAKPRYSSFVAISKRALWVVALALTVTLLYAVWDSGSKKGARFTVDATTNETLEEVSDAVMIHPRYHSTDEENRPYTIIAERAIQQENDEVQLIDLSADMLLEDRQWVVLTANNGLFNKTENKLDLSGMVNMFYEDGFEFRSERAMVDIEQGTVQAKTYVEGQGPTGTLQADRYAVKDKGKHLFFYDNVKVVIFPGT